MKIPNLLSVQKKYLPSRERSIQKILTAVSFAPMVLGVLLILPGIGNPAALPSGLFMFVFTLLLSLVIVAAQKQTKKKYLKRFTDEQLKRMESECLSAPQYEGFMVTGEALLYFMPAILALPIRELVWVYPMELKYHKGALQKTYYYIAAVTKDKKEYVLLRENMEQRRMERAMVFLNEQLKKLRPHLFVGYSDILAAMYKKEFNRMIQMADSGIGVDEAAVLPENICDTWKQEL